mmetsp:Transcript_29573/g.28778  ORF Transcript_29573/g.28778 Transcript_29573/m.28778 type:complete len:122 (+) Transcript_29573:1028-1393(+)
MGSTNPSNLVGLAKASNTFLNEKSSVSKSRIQSMVRPTSSSTFNLENSYMQPPPISELVTPSNNVNLISNQTHAINAFNQPLTSTNGNHKQKFVFNKKNEGEVIKSTVPPKNIKINHSSLI